MPIHLTSRRQFIAQMGAAAVLTHQAALSAEVDENLIAILNDTHVGGRHPEKSPIPTNLRNTVTWLLAQPKRPAAVVINGDLALRDGQPDDYRHFAKLISPLQEAGVPLHLTMGNHDTRDVFHEVLVTARPQQGAVQSRHISVVKLAHANLFLLDSLKQTMIAPGELGEQQLAWLAQTLDAHADKPALIFVHHNPRLGGDPVHFPGGLEDSEALWQILAKRPQVKAYVHGHIHHRDFFTHEDIYILNTPAVSYVADKKTSTTGWTMARLSPVGGSFTTHTHLPDHPWNGARVDLQWRA